MLSWEILVEPIGGSVGPVPCEGQTHLPRQKGKLKKAFKAGILYERLSRFFALGVGLKRTCLHSYIRESFLRMNARTPNTQAKHVFEEASKQEENFERLF